MRKASSGMLLAFLMILPFALLFGAPFDQAKFKRDAKQAYGFGTGKTVQEATNAAWNDLIADALTGMRTAKPDGDEKIVITTEIAKSFELGEIRPFINEKNDGVYTIGFQISRAEFAKKDGPRQDALRADLVPQFKAISEHTDKALQDRMAEAGYLLLRLNNEGLYSALSTTKNGPTLFSKEIEKFYSNLVSGLKFGISQDSGLIHSASVVTVTVLNKDKPVPAFPVSLIWTAGKKEAIVTIVTDDQGKANLTLPTDKAFLNRSLKLRVSPGFSVKVPESAFLVSIDKTYSKDYQFRELEELGNLAANEITVPAGAFQAGLVKHDRRAAASIEKARNVNLAAFAIDRYPVTNAMWAAYIDDAKIPEDEWPDLWDNEDFNKPNQPVMGVSYEKVVKFAKWLSSRLGYTKRLPSEDEYEKAARGGQDTIYPWGDQPVTDGNRGNFNGSKDPKGKKYDATSPVGSYENGKNPLGLYDMSGNVWEWTSSAPDSNMADDPSWKLVKGGSWMDGPSELRVSNRRALDPAQGYQDVGFRLVREVNQ